jgi:hypothetical protein
VTGRGIADSQLHKDAAFTLAQADPIGAVKTLARALRQQTPGAQLSALRLFVAALAEHRPEMAREIAADLAAHTGN